MPDISLQYTSDELKAFILLPSGLKTIPSVSELRKYLQMKGIVFGINDAALENIASGKSGTRIEVACGIPIKPGTAARIVYLINISEMGRPTELSDGRVDHKSLNFVINVKKGDPLVRRIPPEPGLEGKTIFGKVLPAPPLEDIRLRCGLGTAISDSDLNLIVAEIDGAVSVNSEGIIEVRREKIIHGDVDYSTGNVNFSGNLQIAGTIRTGFSVETEGNLMIGGNIEDAGIKCNGNIQIKGGAVGTGNGFIECKNISVRYVEHFTIKAEGDCSVAEDIMHSEIRSGGKVNAKSIVGGLVAAADVEVETIGSNAEPRNVIDIGRKQALLQEKESLDKEITQTESKIDDLKNQIFSIVKNNMDENGRMGRDFETRLEVLKRNTVKSQEKQGNLRMMLLKVDRLIDNLKSDSSVSAGHVYPNTLIRIGTGEKLIMEEMKNVRISAGTVSLVS